MFIVQTVESRIRWLDTMMMNRKKLLLCLCTLFLALWLMICGHERRRGKGVDTTVSRH